MLVRTLPSGRWLLLSGARLTFTSIRRRTLSWVFLVTALVQLGAGKGVAPDGSGYWLVAVDGGVFADGASDYGAAAPLHPNAPMVGMAATPRGDGYWLVGADGRVFAFGAATSYGQN